MTVPLVIPNTVETRLLWTFNGVLRAINVLHFTVASGLVVNQALATAWAATVNTADTTGTDTLRAHRSTTWVLSNVGVRDIRTANQPEFQASVAQAGTSAGEALPATNAVTVTLRTALAGRSYRGRVYLPGWTESDNSLNALITTQAQAAATNFVNKIRTLSLSANAMTLGVTSRTLGATNPVVTELVRDNVWDVQRRRKFPVNAS